MLTDELRKEIETAEKKANKIYHKYLGQRKIVNSLKCKELKNKYLGKYVKYWTGSGEFDSKYDRYSYMYIYNIWATGGDEEEVYFEGAGFNYEFSEYMDGTFMYWSLFIQEKYRLYDLLEGTTYHIEIIDKDEFMDAFFSGTNKMIDEHNEFDYTHIKQIFNNDEEAKE